MSAHTFICEVQENGRLTDRDRLEIADMISRYPKKRLRLEFSLYRKRRSDGQNAYYWAVVIPIVTRMLRDFGNEVNEFETHEYLKLNVMKLGRMVAGPDGSRQLVPGSTSDVPLEEWGEKMEMVRSWAALQGTQIPLPGENYNQHD